MENNTSIETLIENSFKELLKIGKEKVIQQDAESRLIFPKCRDGKKRISEQELRFLLVRELEKQKEFFYSVETPTEDEYVFSGSGKKPLSARIDLCIHDSEGKRICLIELKHENVDVRNDILKLLCDSETEQNYFIQLVNNSDSGTIPSIEKKYEDALTFIHKDKIKSCIKIFLFVVSKKSLYKCEINKNGELGKLKSVSNF
ncbi:MAG: hypothetical protein FWC26_00750 [Fibromonadales bacterium]|nr:hypothetical protein [Fibromonadales bacterium]